MIELPNVLPVQSAFFTHILNTAHMGVATLQPIFDSNRQPVDFTINYVNESARIILGKVCNQETDQSPSFNTLFPNAKSRGFFDSLINVLHTGINFNNPELVYSRDGKLSWYNIQISRYEHALAVMIIDVTARKQAQLAYQRQVEFLDGLLTTSTSAIIVYDAIREPSSDPRLTLKQACEQGRIQDFEAVFFNEAFEQLVHAPAQQISSQRLSERLGQPTYAELSPFFYELMKSGQSAKHERYYAHLGKWLSVSGTGLPNGFALIMEDVSARKEAESVQHYQAQELQSLNLELVRSNENLMEFSYVASHDLQEPLRKIRQFGSMLEEQYGEALGEEGKGLLNRMQSAADRMSTLIRDLLNYSRLSRQTIHPDRLDLNELVGGVMTAIELEIAEKQAIVTVEPLGNIIGNATQLSQAFQNLLTNALKFARPGTPPQISISSKSVDLSELPEGFQPAGAQRAYCALQVTDNGIGFDQAHADRIFGAFQRLHNKNSYPGTGIGLAIVKKVVENHGGCITAHSQLGAGATFIIYLPTAD